MRCDTGNCSRTKLNGSGGRIRERDCNPLLALSTRNRLGGCEPDGLSISRQNSANDNIRSRLRLDDAKLAVTLGEKGRATAEQQTHEWKQGAHGSLTTQAQRRRPRGASIATARPRRRSLQRMVRPRVSILANHKLSCLRRAALSRRAAWAKPNRAALANGVRTRNPKRSCARAWMGAHRLRLCARVRVDSTATLAPAIALTGRT